MRALEVATKCEEMGMPDAIVTTALILAGAAVVIVFIYRVLS